MGFYQIKTELKIPATIEEVWDFISSPENLKEITPPSMGFNIVSEALPKKMYPGMIIQYLVKPLAGISTTWVTEITQVEHLKYFVDEQRVGPYSVWHHQHFLERIEGGVMMTDIVSYVPPLGLLGKLANIFLIKGKLKEIFAFRTGAVVRRFGEYKDPNLVRRRTF